MSIDQYQILERLDKKHFAKVFKVRRKSDNEIFAMKQVKLDFKNESEKESILKEVRLMEFLNHPNILTFQEAFYDKGTYLCIIMEFAVEGDILKMIKSNNRIIANFLETDIWNYLIQILRGLLYLQSIKEFHGDIDPANIFLSKGVVKIGLSNIKKIDQYRLSVGPCKTPYYACPESIKNDSYTSSSDLWSLGCFVYEMAALSPPFMDKSLKLLFEKIERAVYTPIPTN